MRCPNCNEEMEDGFLYCKKCGEEIRIVPDYNPIVEDALSGSLQDIFVEEKEKAKEEKPKEEIKPVKTETVKNTPPKKRISGKKIAAIVILVLFVVGIILNFFVMGIRSNSYEYQYKRAVSAVEQKDYEKAMKYLEKAMELQPGQIEMWKLRAQIGLDSNDRELAKESYRYVLENLDPSNQDIYIKLIELYVEDQDMETVKALLESCQESAVRKYFADYIAYVPEASVLDGTYYEAMDIELEAEGQEIYFTTDGTKPTKESTLYEGAIHLEEGMTTIRAVSVTKKGVLSDEAIFKYEISYLEVEPPVVSPVSGEYPGELEIVVQVPDGCTVLYTLDGSLPDLNSKVYTDPIRIRAGTVFTAVSVSLGDRMSEAVVRRYTILPTNPTDPAEPTDPTE